MRTASSAIRSMPRSGIREIMDVAMGMPDCIRLEVGEPNFTTAPHIIEAAVRLEAFTELLRIPRSERRIADQRILVFADPD